MKKTPEMKKALLLSLVFGFAAATFSQDSLSRIQASPQARAEEQDYLSAKKFALGGITFAYGVLRPEIRPIRKLDFEMRDYVVEKHPHFSSKVDNVTMWAPTVSLFALDAFRIKTEHTPKQHLALHVISGAVMSAAVFSLKSISKRDRPDTSTSTSYPSGHTANAFRGADIWRQELKRDHPVLSYGGYAVATVTGMLRIYNNKHWFSDVVTGMGIGFLSSKFAYWLMEKRSRKQQWPTGF